MDGQTMNLDFSNNLNAEQLRQLIQRMGQFVALYEVAEEKLRQRETLLEEHLHMHESYVNQQLERIHYTLQEFERLMTEAGVARWRLAAEDTLRQGQDHVKALESAAADFRQLSNETCDRLDRATSYTVKGVSEAVNSFRVADFRKLTETSCQRIEQVAIGVAKQVAQVTRWFYWKKAILVFCLSVLVAVIMGLYINGEWPWEDHRNILQQRDLGRAALHVWTQLSPHDQQEILKHLTDKPV